jgi:hypothetical protein
MGPSLGSGRIKDKESPPIHLLITRWRSAGQQGIREDITTTAHSLKNESLTHIETIDGGLFSPLPFLHHKFIRLAMFEHPDPPDVRSIARSTVFQYPDSLKLGSAGQKTEIGPIYMRNA